MDNTHKIKKIEFQLTTYCNMGCKFCFNKNDFNNTKMSPETVCKVINEMTEQNKTNHPLLNFKSVWLTGGEPLLVEKSVITIIKECKLLGLNVGLSTNALLLDMYLDELIDAGLDEIRVSIDSIKKEAFEKIRGKENSLETIMRNVALSINSGLKTAVRITITSENVDEIENIVTKMVKMGVSKIELKGIIPVGGANFKMMAKHSKLEEAFRLGVNATSCSNVTEISVMCNYLPRCEGYSVSQNIACVCGYSAIYVSANGAVTPCSYFPKESDFNIYDDAIIDAWQSELFNRIRNDIPKKCVGCNDWDNCRNGCPAILHSNNKIGKSCFDVINAKNRNLS